MQSKPSSGRSEPDRARYDRLFCDLAKDGSLPQPLIVCLQSGVLPPRFAAPMKREPLPPIGQCIGPDFGEEWRDAVALNPAVHDGAVMAAPDGDGIFRVVGWSYRLFPPQLGIDEHSNRGSAFNSCLAMCAAEGMDRIYLVTRGECWHFTSGRGELISPP